MSRSLAIVLLAILSAASASTVQAQSLAEAAQQEAARRKEVKGTARVLTNKDLPNVPPATAPTTRQTPTSATPAVPSSTTGAPAAGAGSAGAKNDQAPKDDTNGKRDEKYWRDRIAAAKTEVERNQIFVDALQARINALTTDFVNRDDPAQRALLADDRQKSIAELARLKKAIVEGTRAIGTIEDEARRAGVPPGWLR